MQIWWRGGGAGRSQARKDHTVTFSFLDTGEPAWCLDTRRICDSLSVGFLAIMKHPFLAKKKDCWQGTGIASRASPSFSCSWFPKAAVNRPGWGRQRTPTAPPAGEAEPRCALEGQRSPCNNSCFPALGKPLNLKPPMHGRQGVGQCLGGPTSATWRIWDSEMAELLLQPSD